MYIAIAGNIGSGKTTLTRLLAEHYGWEPHYETISSNPYIADYYRDLHRWSFNMEVFYLKERFRTLLELSRREGTFVQDRTLFEGAYVFTANNYAMGNLTERDYRTYMALLDCIIGVAPLPDLMIYLRASVPHLVENIQRRGRDYEQTLSLEYLQNLNERYEEFARRLYPGRLLALDVDGLDFLNHPADFASVVESIDGEFFGLFTSDATAASPDTNTP